MSIRKAESGDLSRIAEIYVFNNRINYFPIFNDESYSLEIELKYGTLDIEEETEYIEPE